MNNYINGNTLTQTEIKENDDICIVDNKWRIKIKF